MTFNKRKPVSTELAHISLQAMARATDFRCLQVTGHHSKHQLQILIDSGSTHNFLNSNIASKLHQVTSEKMNKILQREGQLSLIQVFSIHTTSHELFSVSVEHDAPSHVDIESLLCYPAVFTDPTTIPPSRLAFDHKIPLKEHTDPINIRPYRYSLAHKDIIETLTKELLDQGVI